MSRAEGGHPFIDLGLGSRGAYTQGGSICIPGVGLPDIYLLSRREKYTRVYTFVYPRVHNSIHACTLPRSKYVPSRVLLIRPSGQVPGRSGGRGWSSPEHKIIPSKYLSEGNTTGDHASALELDGRADV